MKDFGFIPSRWSPFLQSLLRIIGAFLYLAHGTQKLFAFPSDGGAHTVQLLSLFGAAGVIECVGGTLLLIGRFTRPVAFIVSGEMAVAYFMFNSPNGFWPILNGGELPVIFCFLFLYFAAAGPGPWSVDARLGAS